MIPKKTDDEVSALPGQPLQNVPVPPSPENFRELLQRAVFRGCVRISPHFKKRSDERTFNVSDAYSLIEDGKIVDGPQYDSDYHTFRCEIVGQIDGKTWKLVTALECGADLIARPVATLITAHRANVRKRKKD